MHSVTKHLTRPTIAFVLPAQRDGLPGSCGCRGTRSLSRDCNQPDQPSTRSGLRLESAGSSLRAAESCSQYCYGLHIRLRLLSTPPRGDAVTFGYRERASPGGGLSPPRSRLLPGARIPAFVGMAMYKQIDDNRFQVVVKKIRTVKIVMSHPLFWRVAKSTILTRLEEHLMPKKISKSDMESRKAEMELQKKEIKERLRHIKKKILVMSWKGGVGKSSVAAYLSVALAKRGYMVGLMDLDLHGPDIP